MGRKPATFVCNGIVAATYNVEFMRKLGEQAGEEGIWAGYNGIYHGLMSQRNLKIKMGGNLYIG